MSHLERQLGLGAVVAISISSMLGSGVFVLPGVAVSLTGSSLWQAYLLAAICVLPAAMSKSELATAMPTSGGTYVYLERTFGPLFGTVAGLGLWASLLLKSSFALVGIGAYLSTVATIPIKAMALGLLSIIVAVNILGVGKVGSAMIINVVVTITALLGLALVATIKSDLPIDGPLYSHGAQGLFVAAGLVFVSYAGVTKVAAIAEEIKDPERNLPRGIIISLLIVTAIYCLISYTLTSSLPFNAINGNLRPIYTLGRSFLGETGGYGTVFLAVLTMASMANAGVLAASRFPFAMSRDGLLPAQIGQLSERYLTPVVSILASGAAVALAIVALDVVKIAKLASVFILMIYLAENLAVIVLREARVRWYAPRYKSPLYPYVQIFGIVSGLALLVMMRSVLPVAILAALLPGLGLYFCYSQFRTNRRGVIGIRGRRRDLVSPVEHGKNISKTATRSSSAGDASPNIATGRFFFPGDATVVVALFGDERSPEMLVELGIALANSDRLEVCHVKEVPEQTNLQDFHSEPAEVYSLRRRVRAMAAANKALVDFDHLVSHDIFKTVYELSQRFHCRWLVKEWGGRTLGAFTLHNRMGWLENRLACHVVTYRDAGVRYIRRILVYVEQDNHDRIRQETADHMAQVHGAEVTFVTVIAENASLDTEQTAKEQLLKIGAECTATTRTLVYRQKDPVKVLTKASVEHDLLIIRNSRTNRRFARLFGSAHDRLIENAACSVISIQSYEPQTSTTATPKAKVDHVR